MKDTLARLLEFRDRRDWMQFHTPKNLIMALAGEVGELSQLYRWDSEPAVYEVEDEIADCFIMLLNLCNTLGIDDPERIINRKIDRNEARYTVGASKGRDVKL